jgi:hypothetical protein
MGGCGLPSVVKVVEKCPRERSKLKMPEFGTTDEPHLKGRGKHRFA